MVNATFAPNSDRCPHCGQVGTISNPVEKQYTRGRYRGLSCKACVAAGKQDVYQSIDSDIVEKLRAVLAMTHSKNENESALAMARLQELMTAHNLTIADLEQRGAKGKPQIEKKQFDLGKAAFKWKLDLASVIADHYFCVPLVDRGAKTVQFLGRPENVESLNMLYGWVIEQIKAISADERKKHIAESGEHVDPLRWQVNFGLGVVQRLYTRLDELAKQRSTTVTSLVLAHKSEISDWMEENLGYRVDGQDTKRVREWKESNAKNEARLKELKATNLEQYYKERPWERPEEIERRRLASEKDMAKARKAAVRRQQREMMGQVRKEGRVDWRKEGQAYNAREAGRKRAEDINVQPFVKGHTS
jgi:hypothetical protein